MCVINDPLGQIHNVASSDHYSHLKFVLFCEILKSGEGRMDGRTNVQTPPPRVKLEIKAGHDYGSASWINMFPY